MSQTPKSRSVRATTEGLEKVRQTMAQLEKPRKRDDKGWTQEDLAERSGASLSTVKRFLNEEPVDKQTIIQITRALGFQPTDIVAPLEWNPPKTSSSVIPGHEVCRTMLEPQQELASNVFISIPKAIEDCCYATISQPGALIRIKAPRGMGKTLLMSKVLNHAANNGYRTVALNLRLAESPDFTNLDQFLQWFCNSVGVMQELPNMVDEHWNKKLGNSKLKCTSYFQEYLLTFDSPLVLALDEVDRVFPYPTIAGDFLGMLRTWHELAKTRDIWKRLRLVVVHVEDYTQMRITQSPFNVGTEIKLLEFTEEEVCKLVQMNGLDWDTAQAKQLMDMVSGLPYLVQQAVSHLRTHNDTTLQQLLATAPTSAGIYGDHLQRLLLSIQQQPELVTAFKQVVTATARVQLNSEQASKLHSMGLVHLQGNQVTPSCELYRQYFCAQL